MAVFLIRQDRIRQDRVGLGVILAVAFIAVPLFGSPFLMEVVMIPFLVLSLATIGLNLLIGYTGLISLGGLCCKIWRCPSGWVPCKGDRIMSDFKGRHFEGETVL